MLVYCKIYIIMSSCNCCLDDQQQSLTDLDVQQQSLTDIVTINVITYILLTNLIFSGANFLYDFKKYMKDTFLILKGKYYIYIEYNLHMIVALQCMHKNTMISISRGGAKVIEIGSSLFTEGYNSSKRDSHWLC